MRIEIIQISQIESESDKESKGDINISVVVIGKNVMVTAKVSGIRLHRFLIIFYSPVYSGLNNNKSFNNELFV